MSEFSNNTAAAQAVKEGTGTENFFSLKLDYYPHYPIKQFY